MVKLWIFTHIRDNVYDFSTVWKLVIIWTSSVYRQSQFPLVGGSVFPELFCYNTPGFQDNTLSFGVVFHIRLHHYCKPRVVSRRHGCLWPVTDRAPVLISDFTTGPYYLTGLRSTRWTPSVRNWISIRCLTKKHPLSTPKSKSSVSYCKSHENKFIH